MQKNVAPAAANPADSARLNFREDVLEQKLPAIHAKRAQPKPRLRGAQRAWWTRVKKTSVRKRKAIVAGKPIQNLRSAGEIDQAVQKAVHRGGAKQLEMTHKPWSIKN